jgi:hypothetical protein
MSTILAWFTPEKVIAIATIIYALVTIVMSLSIRRQASVAEIASKAAKQSADALINTERAWVMAELGWCQDSSARVVGGATRTQGQGSVDTTTLWVKLICRNEGKSPAWIENVYAHAEIVQRALDATGTRKSEGQTFGPMGPLGVGKELSHTLELTCSGITGEGKFISVFIILDYRDVFGLERQTSLGYSVDPNRNLVRQYAFPERNRNT